MSPVELVAYLGPAFLGALALSLVISALFWACAAPLKRATQLTLLLSIFFLALTQHPFPNPALMSCENGGAQPILTPFETWYYITRLWTWTMNQPEIFPKMWIGSQKLQAAGMNFLLCAAIGAAFARHVSGRSGWAKATALAVGLSLGAELTQLTAVWGLFPCPYRQFEIDDLILNISGLLTGFGLMRLHKMRKARP